MHHPCLARFLVFKEETSPSELPALGMTPLPGRSVKFFRCTAEPVDRPLKVFLAVDPCKLSRLSMTFILQFRQTLADVAARELDSPANLNAVPPLVVGSRKNIFVIHRRFRLN